MPGKYYEDLEPGMIIKHELARTITEADNVLFSSLTMNTQPLHINEDFAAKTQFKQRIVNGLLTMSLVVGISVNDLTIGTIIANLGYENVSHPAPVFHGDTIYVETTVVSRRESKSRPDTGVVTLKHIGRNQDDVVVCEVTRSALFLKRPTDADSEN
ncbi:MAG: MaoC family dehydratase [Anaerolineae bacterium]|uniref:MaoC family dehydratase n=1 Tax=Candidatus Flexifilum breve TaxID=3140694 RepID=UPI001ACD2C70|nr:MaoC family dehydratase [Chloroflexota bacterium]MBK9749130.1 MaoC family dehydratase [Chloroflexota bacterium]MBN8636077.1 MaoC family dehydratase [Anaerolineae bacterium]